MLIYITWPHMWPCGVSIVLCQTRQFSKNLVEFWFKMKGQVFVPLECPVSDIGI